MLPLFLTLFCVSLSYGYTVVSYDTPNIRVQPKGTFTITLTLQIKDAPADISVVYTGDAEVSSSAFTTFFGGSSLPLSLSSKNGETHVFSGSFTAPPQEGVMHPTWSLGSDTFRVVVDVTCSDGVYCNGVERWVRGRCTAATAMPCIAPSGDRCSSYACIEDTKQCGTEPLGGPDCVRCLKAACKPNCKKGVTCGNDGCGGSCGSCGADTFCVAGSCGVVTQLGSCANPEPLFGAQGSVVPLDGISNFEVFGDSSDATLDMTTPVCNSPGVPEYVYKFTVPETAVQGMGFEIRITCPDGSNACDTLLAVHNANCEPFTLTAVDRLCSDDQTPPGNLASRVDGKLPPGTYTLIASGYATSTTGPFKLSIKFTPGCYPKCEGLFCGDDGCGGSCGACGSGTECYFGRCQAVPCKPDCKGKQCGPDGCGGFCGFCKGKRYCDDKEGQCVPVKACNSFVADCPNNRQGNGPRDQFCGSDCQWHRLSEPVPDLVPSSRDEVEKSTIYQWANFPAASCALAEKCVSGTGDRLLMSFDTFVHNIGTAGLVGDSIAKNPDSFTWASCHQHYHFEKFARFNLYSFGGKELRVLGAKLSYCMEDAVQHQFGNEIFCDPQFDCSVQGIPRGRSDLYAASLDCQWLDITDLKKGCWYTYEVCTNIGRTIFEMTYDNNCNSFPIYVPDVPLGSPPLTLAQAMVRDNAQSFFGGCKP